MNLLPDYQGRCGDWAEKYQLLHHKIRSGQAAPRYVVYHCGGLKKHCGGLADRMIGMVSTFLFGILTDRAVIIRWDYPAPPESVLAHPLVDWRYNITDPIQNATNALLIDWLDQELGYFRDLFLKDADLNAKYPQDTIYFHTSRGMVWHAVSESVHSARLRQMGFLPDTAFGCIINHFLHPHKDLVPTIEEFGRKLRGPGVFSVGLQIRSWDEALRTEQEMNFTRVSQYQGYFECAERLSNLFAGKNQTVYWYLATDDKHVKSFFGKKYAHLLQLDDNWTIAHVDYNWRDPVAGLRSAVVDHFVLSMCDKVVMTHTSGFGKLAYFRSMRTHSCYQPGRRGDCSTETDNLSIRELSYEWQYGK
eukprot:CAMPEP_0184650320 /NCGR_PEP_ID=MMETSP0308-20130426/7843_1 /TAXON_ID=38269 /ORGANISM="Gloeochaete witrockiana, Strain SAG 46.84" /LENGTH=361 /DNA_ID=CAMNT_0027083755 /DNA_START=222 /DNA_END=1307 /DNA_ORIENTATION=-